MCIRDRTDLTVGERILSAVQATQEAVGLNTNLGIILLCAPMIQAVSYTHLDVYKRQVEARAGNAELAHAAVLKKAQQLQLQLGMLKNT